MVLNAIADYPDFELSNVELKRPGPSYMIDTIQALQSESAGNKWFLLIGADNLGVQWKDWERILDLVTVVVYPRSGVALPTLVDERILHLGMPLLAYSATEIRENIKAGKVIQDQVPQGVADYIDAHQLYR